MNILKQRSIYKLKWKAKNTTQSELSQKSHRKSTERWNIDTSITQIHEPSHSWIGAETPIKSGSDKLVLWVQSNGIV